MGADRDRGRGPPGLDERTGAGGPIGVRRLGWVAVLALPGVWTRAGAAAGVLMLLGGLLYTAGALAYHQRRPDPCPAVFGYHEVFHACVCAAAACQYAAIALFVAKPGLTPAGHHTAGPAAVWCRVPDLVGARPGTAAGWASPRRAGGIARA